MASAQKEYKMLFQLSAQVGKDFGSTFSAAQQQMNLLQKEINQLNQVQRDISAYQKQQTAVEATRRKLEDLQKQHDNIQREYEETGESSSTLANKMIDKQRAIDQTTQKLEQQTQKLDQMETELKEAGVNTDLLGEEQQKLAQQIDQAAKETTLLREELTAETQEQYWQLKDLQEEYDAAVEAYGENSEEAAYLRWQVEELSAEYETGKQTLHEYADELGAMAEELGGNVEAYRAAKDEINRQEVTSLALIHRLEELAGQANRTAVEEEEMKRVIAELNDLVPDLNLSFEKLSSSQPNFMKSVEAMVKQRAETERNKAALDTMVDAYMDIADAKTKLEDKETVDNLEAVRKAAEDTEAAYFGMYGSAEGLGAILALLTPEYRAWQDALKEKDYYEGKYEELGQQLKDAQEAYDGAHTSLEDYYKAQTDAEAAAAAMNATLSTAQEQLAALTASYTEAYDAALESVQGQFSLWDEAKEPVAVTTDTIITSLADTGRLLESVQRES